MTKRTKIQQRRLEEIESEFGSLLFSCLNDCARGRWGLFGQNGNLDPDLHPEGRFWNWDEATRLKQLAQEISYLRVELGGQNILCDKYLGLCSLRGSNVLGEPKLAAEFLAEIEKK